MAKRTAGGDAAPAGTAAPDGAPSFENLLGEAEALAERMEEGGLSLDESLQAYEKGVGNLRRCAELLREAEEKVKLLVEKDGGFRLEDLDPAAGGAAGDDEGEG